MVELFKDLGFSTRRVNRIRPAGIPQYLPPILTLTANGKKAEMLADSSFLILNSDIFKGYSLNPDQTLAELINILGATERDLKTLIDHNASGPFNMSNGWPAPMGLAVVKLVAGIDFINSHQIPINLPLLTGDWTNGRGYQGIEKIYHRPIDTETLYHVIDDMIALWANIYSISSHALYDPKSQRVHCGMNVVKVGRANRTGNLRKKAEKLILNSQHVASGADLLDLIRLNLVVPIGDKLPVSQLKIVITLDEARRLIKSLPVLNERVPRELLVDAHDIQLDLNNSRTGYQLDDELGEKLRMEAFRPWLLLDELQ